MVQPTAAMSTESTSSRPAPRRSPWNPAPSRPATKVTEPARSAAATVAAPGPDSGRNVVVAPKAPATITNTTIGTVIGRTSDIDGSRKRPYSPLGSRQAMTAPARAAAPA